MKLLGKRRRAAILLASMTLAIGLAGCTSNTDSGSGSSQNTTSSGAAASPVTIRFYFWGDANRNTEVGKAIDLFEQDNPTITVQPEFTDWSGYWDKLSTEVAGGNTPDVFMQEDRYIGDYSRRGLLADLESLGVPTNDIDSGLLSNGRIDGKLVGIPTGSNVYGIIINPTLFQQAGVAIPDDSTWTWDDYVSIAEQIHNNIPGGTIYGTSDSTYNEVGFEIYLRQHGEDLFDAQGNLAYDDELLVDWWKQSLALQSAGGQPPADEAASLDLDDSPLAKGYAAMSMTWSSQMGQLASDAGTDLQILKMPGESQFKREGMYFKPGMYLSASAKSKTLDADAKFIDFFANDPRVGQIFGTELGLSGNSTVRDAVIPQLTGSNLVSAQFVQSLNDHIIDSRMVLPNGAGNAATIIQQLNEQVLFGQLTPEAAATQFRTQLQAAISQ